MNYTDSFLKLKEIFSSVKTKTEFEDYEISRHEFTSLAYDLLPGKEDYHCNIHNMEFNDFSSYYNDIGTIQEDVHIKDVCVEENRTFSYFMIKPIDNKRANKVIFLFHGFNEKNWDKYLPWGKAICERTGNAVIFFPIAFHMQRAPLQWSEKRKMFELSEKRKKRFPNIIKSTLSNVAISMRLHSMPQRFIWSGLQTYYDLIQFVKFCKDDKHELISKDLTSDIFAYSIGGFLAEILKLSNHENYFRDSKVCLFCSGAVFNRLSPVSKYILDSETNVALYSFLVEHFESFLKKDQRLNHYINGNHIEGKVFHSMLDYQKMREFREGLFKSVEKQVYAISLKRDSVIPTFEIINTLKGALRNINIKVEELDFNCNYTHENPFPLNSSESQTVDENFNMVFDKVCNFFNS